MMFIVALYLPWLPLLVCSGGCSASVVMLIILSVYPEIRTHFYLLPGLPLVMFVLSGQELAPSKCVLL